MEQAMSNAKTFALTKIEKAKFVCLEHGQDCITLSIVESSPHKSMEILLSCIEAKKIVFDLSARIQEVEFPRPR